MYPVEFRDFFLGDIYCSLTYATCVSPPSLPPPVPLVLILSELKLTPPKNIELFFCIYANKWENPSQCNSSSSRLLGFLAALPPIWRFLQCLRRYRDTRNVFPHLVNGGKYTMSIVAAVTLSLYRISPGAGTLGAFIAFSTINAIYCCMSMFSSPYFIRFPFLWGGGVVLWSSVILVLTDTAIWDLFMDFSLLQPRSPAPLLRPITALKPHMIYYAIMTIDPILRFSWIAIAIFTHDKQHSTVVSFIVGLLEVTRRGLWALIRVENEHCANVGAYKASRDVPLPYVFEEVEDTPETDVDEEGGAGVGGAGGMRGREGTGLSRILADAHVQDFEKRRRDDDGVVEEAEEGSDGEGSEEGMGSGGISEDEGVKLP